MAGPAALAAPAAAAASASASALLEGADGSEGGQQWVKRLIAQLSQVQCWACMPRTCQFMRSTALFFDRAEAIYYLSIPIRPSVRPPSQSTNPTPIYHPQTCNQSDLHAALRVALTEPLEAEQAHLVGAAAARASTPGFTTVAGRAEEAAPEPPPPFVTPERLERLRRAIQRRGHGAAAATR